MLPRDIVIWGTLVALCSVVYFHWMMLEDECPFKSVMIYRNGESSGGIEYNVTRAQVPMLAAILSHHVIRPLLYDALSNVDREV